MFNSRKILFTIGLIIIVIVNIAAKPSTKPKPQSPVISINVTSKIVKKVGNKHRYFFDVRNKGKQIFKGIVTIKLFSQQGREIFNDSWSADIPPGVGYSVYMEISTGPVLVHGEYGIDKYQYEIKVDEKVVDSGEGKISEKYEDLSH